MSGGPGPLKGGAQPVNAAQVKTAAGNGSGLPSGRVAAATRIVTRWPSARPFMAAASVSIVAGGLVAAQSRPTSFELGPWTAAYLVLVGGVAQSVLGAGTAWLACRPPDPRKVLAELVAWNLGVVAAIVGTLVPAPVVTTFGGLGLGLAGYWFVTTPRSARPRRPLWLPLVWWVTWLMVILSVPFGVGLAWARHG